MESVSHDSDQIFIHKFCYSWHVEPDYLLQPIDSKLENYYSLDDDLAATDREEWNKVFSVLQTCIYRAVKYAPDMDPEYVKDVTQSVTEGKITFPSP